MREYSNPAYQVLPRVHNSDRLSQVAVPLYTEGVITPNISISSDVSLVTRETSGEIEMLGGYLINGPLTLRNAVLYVLKRFASILLKSVYTVSLAQDILR